MAELILGEYAGRTNLTGEIIGELTVLRYVGYKLYQGSAKWFCLCECSCGKLIVLRHDSLSSPNTRSCGCTKADRIRLAIRTHGRSRTLTYTRWVGMKGRCEPDAKKNNRECYYDRGIRVCDRWAHSYEAFLEDMGECPAGLTLERINNDGNYEPGNCRWATKADQRRNTRRNWWITFNGETMLLIDWARRLGVRYGAIRHRLTHGWTVEEALTIPFSRKGGWKRTRVANGLKR